MNDRALQTLAQLRAFLDAQASAMSDNEVAQRLITARATLFKTIFNRSKSAA